MTKLTVVFFFGNLRTCLTMQQKAWDLIFIHIIFISSVVNLHETSRSVNSV